MPDIHYYHATIGTKQFSWYGGDDRIARKKIARWIRMFWDKYRKHIHNNYPGSISDAINNSWYRDPDVYITRIYIDNPAMVVPCVRPTVVENFQLNDETKNEFLRIAL
jgi:hypothetical protein